MRRIAIVGAAVLAAGTALAAVRAVTPNGWNGKVGWQLKLCQYAIGTGWVGAFPETDIDKIIAGVRVWAPWYVQHKILQGHLYWN